MDHIAILKKDWKLLPKILSGEKTIESRWYQTKKAPWNKVNEGDTIYFKNSGEMVTAKAKVKKVLQYEIKDLPELKSLVKKYGKRICLINQNVDTWKNKPKYCILMFLANIKEIEAFKIEKKGYGTNAAWLVVNNILKIRVSYKVDKLS